MVMLGGYGGAMEEDYFFRLTAPYHPGYSVPTHAG